MRARYTAKDQKPELVSIEELAQRELFKEYSPIERRPDAFETASALARLIDVLASREALTGGEVLQVLGFRDGQLELDDGTPRNDAERRDYWADRDAAFGKEREALHSESANLYAKMAAGHRGMATALLEQPVELGEVSSEQRAPEDGFVAALALVLGLSVERAWPDLLADVAKLNRKCAERGVLIDAIRTEVEDCEDARDAVLSIASRLGVSVKP
jgi:hypothetical protein